MFSYFEMLQVKIFIRRAFGFLWLIYPKMQNTLFYHLKKTASKNSLSFSRYFNFTKVKERFGRTVISIILFKYLLKGE